MTRYSPLAQLVLTRVREFFRQPGVVFWVYGFPVLMMVTLGTAFRNQPVRQMRVDVQEGAQAADTVRALASLPAFGVTRSSADLARLRLRTGKTDLIIAAGPGARYDYVYDPTRPEGLLARNAADDALQRAGGRKDVASLTEHIVTEPGARYIDFLVPGLLAMGLMSGGLWGVGYAIVDMRIRRLLKRFIATPMKRHDFLAAMMLSRFLFIVPEAAFLLLFATLAFGIRIQGSLWALSAIIGLGAFTFSGMGLLVASRAGTIETINGLLNAVMMPMWLLCGIFFWADRFPEAMQPIIAVLPLTPLITSLRAVMLEGQSLAHLWREIALMAGWGAGTFVLALRWFRWR